MKQFWNALLLLLTFAILTGIVYPLFITAIAYLFFPEQAKGSLIYDSKKQICGSSLIGQNFSNKRYFWSRPSAVNYNPMPSGGTNLSLVSIQLKDTVESRRQTFRAMNNLSKNDSVPNEMLFASASGLDPHISPAAAQAQVSRVIDARGCTPQQRTAIQNLIVKYTDAPQLGFLGADRVNVLLLNRGLDSLTCTQ
jgi:potassium-transporting ATPase KdpC subunit